MAACMCSLMDWSLYWRAASESVRICGVVFSKGEAGGRVLAAAADRSLAPSPDPLQACTHPPHQELVVDPGVSQVMHSRSQQHSQLLHIAQLCP